MSDENESGFKFYSFGIVAANKDRKSRMIKVVPVEAITLATGKSESMTVKAKSGSKTNVSRTEEKSTVPMGKQTMNYNVEIPDHKGVGRSEKVSGDLMVVAEWTAFGQSNRITAPDVRQGETVMIFKTFDTDDYYWTSMMNEPGIRRQETVCYMFGNIPDGTVSWDKDSSYWMEVSTHDKHIKLHTSNNDGEAAAYDVGIDTANGVFSVVDSIGNSFILDSAAGTLNGVLLASINLKAPNTTIEGNFKVTGTSSLSGAVDTGGAVSIGAGLSVSAGLSTGAGGGGGDVTIGGNVQLTGNINGNGSISIDGPISASNI